MEIYISSSANKDLKKVIRFASDLGANLEISRFGRIETLDKEFEQRLEFYQKELSQFKGKITFHSFFHGLNPASQDIKIKEITKIRYNQALKIAKTINANTIVFHTGYNGLTKHPVYHRCFIENTIYFWRKFVKEFENADITAVLENTYEPTPEVITKIIDGVNSNNLKACIDTGHININSLMNVTEWIEAFGHRLHHMHLHNNNNDFDLHNALQDGTINFEKVIEFLREKNLSPQVVLEIFNEEDVKKSYEFLKLLDV
ncbi:MAG: sugar phosphate isomerase/epimerase [Candidatus Gastranaerophilales bacterium]|nr:sugar phosphate isomerase/epimerase [Candidatus Gastranaerophilales bacterium]